MLVGSQYRCPGCMRLLNSENDLCTCGYKSNPNSKYTHRLREGTVLANNYVIGKVIGEGGFGITYVGWDLELEMKVAIKEFYLKGYATRNCTVSDEITSCTGESDKLFEGYRDKFSNEARTLARFMSEPGIVSVYRHFRENNTAYIVMEFLEGETLKDLLDRRGVISVGETIAILEPVMNSLSRIHEKNLIHRDISPDNIIITVDGYGKLLDFGSARDYSDGNKSLSVVLKHGYAPPEQYQSHGKQGPWTDVYAMGATIYRCITGEKPTEAVERAVGAELSSPLEKGANCSVSFNDTIMKALSISINERYQTMGDLARELKCTAIKRNAPVKQESEQKTKAIEEAKKEEQIRKLERLLQEKKQLPVPEEQLPGQEEQLEERYTRDSHIREQVNPYSDKYFDAKAKPYQPEIVQQNQNENKRLNAFIVAVELVIVGFMLMAIFSQANSVGKSYDWTQLGYKLVVVIVYFIFIIALAAKLMRRNIKNGSVYTLIAGVISLIAQFAMYGGDYPLWNIFFCSILLTISVGICAINKEE